MGELLKIIRTWLRFKNLLDSSQTWGKTFEIIISSFRSELQQHLSWYGVLPNEKSFLSVKRFNFIFTLNSKGIHYSTKKIPNNNIFLAYNHLIFFIDLLNNKPPYIFRARWIRKQLVNKYMRTIKNNFINIVKSKFLKLLGWESSIDTIELTSQDMRKNFLNHFRQDNFLQETKISFLINNR